MIKKKIMVSRKKRREGNKRYLALSLLCLARRGVLTAYVRAGVSGPEDWMEANTHIHACKQKSNYNIYTNFVYRKAGKSWISPLSTSK